MSGAGFNGAFNNTEHSDFHSLHTRGYVGFCKMLGTEPTELKKSLAQRDRNPPFTVCAIDNPNRNLLIQGYYPKDTLCVLVLVEGLKVTYKGCMYAQAGRDHSMSKSQPDFTPPGHILNQEFLISDIPNELRFLL